MAIDRALDDGDNISETVPCMFTLPISFYYSSYSSASSALSSSSSSSFFLLSFSLIFNIKRNM